MVPLQLTCILLYGEDMHPMTVKTFLSQIDGVFVLERSAYQMAVFQIYPITSPQPTVRRIIEQLTQGELAEMFDIVFQDAAIHTNRRSLLFTNLSDDRLKFSIVLVKNSVGVLWRRLLQAT